MVLGFFLPRIAEWADTLPGVPFWGSAPAIASWEGRWAAIGLVAAGLVLGLVAAAAVLATTLKVTLTDTEILGGF